MDTVGEGRPGHPGRLPDPGGGEQAVVPVLAGVHGGARRGRQQHGTRLPKRVRPAFTVQNTPEKLKLQIAVSDYRQGKWTPKKVSKDSYESARLQRRDRSQGYTISCRSTAVAMDGRFRYCSLMVASLGATAIRIGRLLGGIRDFGLQRRARACRHFLGIFKPAIRPEGLPSADGDYRTEFLKWVELGTPDDFGTTIPRHDLAQDDFTLENTFAPPKAARLRQSCSRPRGYSG